MQVASTGWDVRSIFAYGPLGLIAPLVAFFLVLFRSPNYFVALGIIPHGACSFCSRE